MSPSCPVKNKSPLARQTSPITIVTTQKLPKFSRLFANPARISPAELNNMTGNAPNIEWMMGITL